jgi:glycosyltransferase involved in cell wall biosynthesis
LEVSVEPPHEALRSLYASADVWVYAARVDGFGLPILEAMACGTPVVATHAGAAPELIDNTVGRLVTSDADAMAAALLTILRQTDDDWRAQSAAAQARVRAYTWDDAAARMEQCLIKATQAER